MVVRITVTLLAYAVALLLLAAPLAEAQQTRRIPRAGVLGGQSPEGSPPILALRQGLSELGYVEGETIVLEWRWAQSTDPPVAARTAPS
jgi:putative ABC transport system substrate-binding protein